MRFEKQGETMKYKNLFYFSQINKIGGVETFYWYLAQKYGDKDIVIVYREGDTAQIARLRQYVRVVKFEGQRFQCEKAFFNYTIDIIDYVDADEYIQVIHGDYKAFGIKPYIHPKITRRIGVSQLVCDTFEEVTGQHCDMVYNPLVVPKPKKVLNLVSATRLTKEKGKDRMAKLADLLEQHNMPFLWTVFTDSVSGLPNENIIYKKPKLEIIDYIANADYLVQLSDCEGYCFSVAEALCVGTPVIVSACPVFKEIGVEDGKNGFILPFDMSSVPLQKIYKGLPKFKYEPKADGWGETLAEGESTYKNDLKKTLYMRSKRKYYDLQLNRLLEKGDVFTAKYLRAIDLAENGYAEILQKGG